METNSVTCNICNTTNQLDAGCDTAKVASNVRQFQEEQFTVWRCTECSSLHSLEDIDYDYYYKDYVIHRQKMDCIARLLFSSRLHQLIRGGLLEHHAILDFGCGNGNFIHFLKEKGYVNAKGYDPFSSHFADQSICAQKFDIVTSQDVIEHTPDPVNFLDEIVTLVRRPGGILAIGTPDAEHINLHNHLDMVGQLHQPYHRHIIGAKKLIQMLESRGFRIDRFEQRSYVDTKLPFINSIFTFNYMASADGTLDSIFDPIKLNLIYRFPKLLFYGFFGYFLNQKKDIFIAATAI